MSTSCCRASPARRVSADDGSRRARSVNHPIEGGGAIVRTSINRICARFWKRANTLVPRVEVPEMSGLNWSAPVSDDEAHRRVAGRRHYNSWRRDCAAFRRLEVMQLLGKYGWRHGVAARIA